MVARTTAAGLLLAAAANAQSCGYNNLEVDYPAPEAADGWSYRLVAKDLTKPRGILFDSEGALIVVDSGAGLVRFTLEDEGGTCVSVGEKTTLIEDEDVSTPNLPPTIQTANNTAQPRHRHL